MIDGNVFLSVNYVSVLVAAVAGFAVGGLWYSPVLLGKEWLKEMKLSQEDIKKQGHSSLYMNAFIQGLITALFLAIFFQALGVKNGVMGAYVGLFICIGFVATSLATNYFFEGKSTELVWINIGHHLATFMAMGAIVGAWS